MDILNLTLCLALDLTPSRDFQSKIKSKAKSKSLRHQTRCLRQRPRLVMRNLLLKV